MSTAATVKEQLLKLISLSNEATGNEDADLTTAVMALISGYVKDENGVPVFVADFSGSAPSPGQFYSWEGRVYDGAIYDALSNIKCVDGVAKLTSVYDPDNNRWIKQMMCTGGMFESDDFVCVFKAKLCGTAGSWNNVITYGTGTHWTDGIYSDGVKFPAGGEIDAFEQAASYSENPSYMYPPTIHWGAGTGSGYPNTVSHRQANRFDVSTDVWHDFKFSLKNGVVSCWIDGVQTGEFDVSDATIDNNYMCGYKPFLKPHAFYIDGSCSSSAATDDTFIFEVSDFRVYTEKKVECTGLEIYPQMWEKGTELVFPTGAEIYLDRIYTPTNVSNKACTWHSSNTAVATVVQGYVKVIGEGQATITATCGSATASYVVVASNENAEIPCVKVVAEHDSITVPANDSQTLGYYLYPKFTTDTVSISSSDSGIAKVENGTVSGVSEGTTNIAINCGNRSAIVNVAVTPVVRTPFAEYTLSDVGSLVSGTVIPNTGSSGAELDITMSSSSQGKSTALSATMNLKAYPLLYIWKNFKPSAYGQKWYQNGNSGNVMPSLSVEASTFKVGYGAGSYYAGNYEAGDVFNIAVYSTGSASKAVVNGEVVATGNANYIATAFSYYSLNNPSAFDYFAGYLNYEFTEDELIAMTQLDS